MAPKPGRPDGNCADGDCPTLGVEAVPLSRYADVDTEDGEWIIYDLDAEDGWIQSDLYFHRANCV